MNDKNKINQKSNDKREMFPTTVSPCLKLLKILDLSDIIRTITLRHSSGQHECNEDKGAWSQWVNRLRHSHVLRGLRKSIKPRQG